MLPEEYEQAGRDFPEIYGRLHALAEKTADIRFWGAIAKQERKCKHRSDKIPSIDFSYADDLSEMSDDDEVTREIAGEIDSFFHPAGASQGQTDSAKRPLRENSDFKATKKAKTTGRHQQQHTPQPDGDEVVDIYIGNGNDQKIFRLSRNNINKSSYLKELVQGKFPYIFHPFLHQMSPAEFEPVYAFLSRDDSLDSDLVSVSGDGAGDNDEDDAGEDILGDVGRLGKHWKIKDVHNIEELKAYILKLVPTYAQACMLGLFEMADTVIANVQVAWNVYGRVEQLPVFLDFIEGVMQDPGRRTTPGALPGGQASYGLGAHQQLWIVRFLAETFVPCATESPQRFWPLMARYPGLRAAVLKHRGLLDDTRILNLEQKFLQREPLTEADFVISVKPAEATEQEAGTKDKEGKEQVAEANE